MEKTRNERQTLWDGYINRALGQATWRFAQAEGARYFSNSFDKEAKPFVVLIKEILDLHATHPNSPAAKANTAHFESMGYFFEGYCAETLVLSRAGNFVCVRVDKDFHYIRVSAEHWSEIKSHARSCEKIYDLRMTEIALIKSSQDHGLANVLVTSF